MWLNRIVGIAPVLPVRWWCGQSTFVRMAHQLRTVDLEFLQRAPHRFVFEAVVPASQKVVFDAISDDPSTWTWWPGHEGGAYESPPPHGVGSRREMHMGDS